MKTRILLTTVLCALLSHQPLASRAEESRKPATKDTGCSSCGDASSQTPCAANGGSGKRVDDGRVYLEFIPPSSEWGGFMGGYPVGSYIEVPPPVVPPEVTRAAEAAQPVPEKNAMERRLISPPAALPPPVPAPVVPAPAKPRMITRLGDTLTGATFATGKDELTPDARGRLDEVIARLRGKRNIHLLAVGYTDNVPIGRHEAMRRFGSNKVLSLARALAVARYLQMALGLPDSALKIDGRGEAEPITDNGTATGQRP